MTTISKAVLSVLLAQPAYACGPTFGVGDHYTAGARVASAGITFAELHAAGLGLQSETHGRSYGHRDWKGLSPAEKASRLRAYYLAHGAVLQPDTRTTAEYRSPDGMYPVGGTPLDARVNPTTCPSGLRPRVIPSGGKIKDAQGNVVGLRPMATAEQVAAWHKSLVSACESTPEGGMVTIPSLDVGEGKTLDTPIPAGEKVTRSTTGPQGWRSFVSVRDSLLGSITALVGALRAADDQTRCGPLSDRIVDWGATLDMDGLAGIGPSDFDTSTIREGSLVTLTPSATGRKALTFMAEKVSKLPQVPEVFRVERVEATTSMCFLTAEGFRKAVPVVLTELRRYVPPTPAVQGTWKPSVGSLATCEGEQVYIDRIEGEQVYIVTDDGTEMDVPLADLSAPV